MSGNRRVRVTCTLPSGLVQAADAIAAREGRSRSWVVAEALRQFAATPAKLGVRATLVREQVVHPYAPEFEESRRRRRDSDLAMTPEQRVQAVDEIAEMARGMHPRPRHSRLVTFDTWDDYFAWKKTDVLP